jgi:hypothetical protein
MQRRAQSSVTAGRCPIALRSHTGGSRSSSSSRTALGDTTRVTAPRACSFRSVAFASASRRFTRVWVDPRISAISS